MIFRDTRTDRHFIIIYMIIMIRSISDTEEKEREASRVSLAASLASERRARNRSPFLLSFLFNPCWLGSIIFKSVV